MIDSEKFLIVGKKEKKKNPAIYKGISLLSLVIKTFANIIKTMVEEIYQFCEGQQGF